MFHGHTNFCLSRDEICGRHRRGQGKPQGCTAGPFGGIQTTSQQVESMGVYIYIYIIIYIHYIIIYHLSYNIFLFYRSGFLRSSLSSGSCCPWSPLVQGAESSNHRCLHVCWNTSGAQPVTGDRGGPRDHPSSAVPGNLCQRILAIKRDKATAGKTMPCLPSPSHHYRWYMVV